MFTREVFPPTPFPNSFWIEPGRLLAGEYPGVPDPDETRERLEALVELGISYFLDLTEPDELPPYDALLPLLRRDRAPSGQETPRLVHDRRPIEDHGLPESDEQMRGILDDMEQALTEGHIIYVHCHAGIGRTNTVTGCWLRRQGLTGPMAMKRLNRLWKANARSQGWSRVPEFHQEQFVLSWVDSSGQATPAQGRRKPASAVANGVESRYLGAVLGAACGDALGSIVRGRKPGHSQPVTGMSGGGPLELAPGAWTDDTALMLCLAQSLVEQGDFDAAHQASLYWDWHQEGRYSATGQPLGKVSDVSKALAATRWSGNPNSGPHDPRNWDAESLTRVCSVVLFARRQPGEAISWSAEASRITNQSPGVLDACRYWAAVLLAALAGADREALALEASRLIGQHWDRPLKPPVAALAASTILPTNAPVPGTHVAVSAIHRVLWVLGAGDDFRTGLLRLVNLGGHSDIQGTLYGQLAGIILGVDAIPAEWRGEILRRRFLESTARKLLKAASQRKPG